MQFHISAQQLEKDRRRGWFLLVFMVFFSAILLIQAMQMDSFSQLLLPAAGWLFLIPGMFRVSRLIRQGGAAYPSLQVDEENQQLILCYPETSVNLELANIKTLRLKTKSGRVLSILIRAQNNQALRFEGYHNMDLLADLLKRMVPADKIRRASFYH